MDYFLDKTSPFPVGYMADVRLLSQFNYVTLSVTTFNTDVGYSHRFKWVYIKVSSGLSSHDSSCSPEVFQLVVSSRRSLLLFQSPRCSYASRLSRQQWQQCSSNLPAAHWARILCHGATGRGATDCCASGDTSYHPHGSSDIPPRAMTLADWSGNTRENAKMTVDFEECIKDSPRFR